MRSALVFGLPAEEIRLTETREGRPSLLELNLINKGDYFTPQARRRRVDQLRQEDPQTRRRSSADDPGAQRDLDRAFEKDLKASEHAAEEALQALFGQGRGQSFRQAERQRVQRWDWQDCAFLLDARQGEFVMVRILPADQADERGRSERRTDKAVKQDLAANVVREKNGDVWIRGIPMVDQGEKGYCAVATAERLLRYYGIAVDSHDLADAAGTGKGGGTTWSGMCAAVERTAGRNQRRFRALGGAVSARSAGRYIDKGIPLIWGLFVTAEIEAVAHRRAEARTQTPAKEWAQRLKAQRGDTRRVKPDTAGGHMRLIVGYNEQTGEIAYSDSWGDPRLYWITEDEARLISFPDACLATVLP